MKLNRNWITPLVAGAFTVIAVTGVLMFFHLDTGTNKFVHEWLSWLLVVFVVIHGITNFSSIKKYALDRRGQFSIGFFIAVLAISFVQIGEKSAPSFVAPVHALAQASLTTFAQVAKISHEQLIQFLQEEGLNPQPNTQRISDLVGQDTKKQMDVISNILTKSGSLKPKV